MSFGRYMGTNREDVSAIWQVYENKLRIYEVHMNRKQYQRIKKYCEKQKLFDREDKVILAVSGGADSVFLVEFMKELAQEWKLSLEMVHVNHGIRGEEAFRDEQFCQKLAKKNGISFTAFHGNVPEIAKSKKMSEEEAARWYRYQCLEMHREKTGFQKIAVAHHQNDQAETMLFQMLRGSSLRGAGGIRPQRDGIVRPLLAVDREEIEEALRESGQSWCEDSTNQEMLYSRNQLRHQVLPYIEKEIAPAAVSHLAELGEQLQEIFGYIEQETVKIREAVVRRNQNRLEVSADAFCKLHIVLQREMVLQMLEELAGSRKDITSQHIKACCQLVVGETGKRISLPYGISMGKDYDVVWLKCQDDLQTKEIIFKEVSQVSEENLLWEPDRDNCKEYMLKQSDGNGISVIVEKVSITQDDFKKWKEVPKKSCTKWFDCARINRMLEFRHPKQGDYFLIGDGKKKKLGRFLIDRKIPQDAREELWVWAMGSHIVWIPELDRVSTEFYVKESTVDILCVSYQ